MKKTFSFASLILAGLVLLAGCQKDGNHLKGGQSIRFTAGSGAPATRTAYSGVTTTVDGRDIERIDWVSGDLIRIYSDKATDRVTNQHFSDYSIGTVTEDGRYSRGTLTTNPDGNGLVWSEEGGDYTFFGVYPSSGATIDPASGAATGATIPASQTVAGTGTGTGSFKIDGTVTPVNTTVLKPDMGKALMFARKLLNINAAKVNLDFYPAYTAFEISLVCGDDAEDVALTGFTLTSRDIDAAHPGTPLTGNFTAVIQEDNATTYTCPTELTSDNGKITFDLTGRMISKSKGLTFTVFALPQDLTNLKIRFDLADGTYRAIDLKKDGAFINFPACRKHRITGIAMPHTTWKFAIDLGPMVLPWELISTETDFSKQISSSKFKITHHNTEMLDPNGDDFEDIMPGDHYYNVRTLKTDEFNHFVVKFTPTAPLGGYWFLTPVPLGGDPADYFIVEVWNEAENLGSPSLQGPINAQEVTLHISLSPNPSIDRTKPHSLILKGNFSVLPDGEEQISADSELQDVHAPDSFSWWKFVFPNQ